MDPTGNCDAIIDEDNNNSEIDPTAERRMDNVGTNNDISWRDVLFYDPSNCNSNLESWLVQNRPSVYINKSASKSIVVLHPNSNVSEYKRANHRSGISVPEDVKEKIVSKKDELDQEEILTMAKACNMFEGLWFLSCKDEPKHLVKAWDSYFIKIARYLYEATAEDENLEDGENENLEDGEDENLEDGENENLEHDEKIATDKIFEFIKIEARWISSKNMGIIMINNESFLPENIVKIAHAIKKLIHPFDAQNGYVSKWFSYKPLFYLTSGIDSHFSHKGNLNIFRQDLTTSQFDGIYIGDFAKKWLRDHHLFKDGPIKL